MSFRIERVLAPTDLGEALRREAREGLTATPKRMRSRWIWDARGSELYERIMELPAYYLPASSARFSRRPPRTSPPARPRTLVELGSGSSVKTTILLDALPHLRRFVAVDVSESALAEAAPRLAERYPKLEVVGVVDDFERRLPPPHGRKRSSLPRIDDRRDRPGATARSSSPRRSGRLGADGALLLGLDLVKPVERIVAAYADDPRASRRR